MAYAVNISKGAQNDIARLPASDQARVMAAIHALANDPRPPGAIKMAGSKNLYRIRVGTYRIIYEIHDDQLLVVVTTVAGRGRVYQIAKRRKKK